MRTWLRGLLDLRSRFDSRADDDLCYMTVLAILPHELAKARGYFDRPADPGPPELPPEDLWRDGRPIIAQFRTSRRPTPAAADGQEPPILIYRHVYFGSADKASWRDFGSWADDAGACIARRPSARSDQRGDMSIWMNYVAATAVQRVE